LLLRVKRIVKRTDDGFLNFRAAQVPARLNQGLEIETLCVASAFREMDAKNFRPLFLARQIHVKNFVEPAFAQKFRRKLGNIIRCQGLLQVGCKGTRTQTDRPPENYSSSRSRLC